MDNVYKLHGMPKFIISDRDPIFTSQFWKLLVARTGTQLNMITTNHPETDGQAERVHQQVECYLRCFISAQPNKWSKWISLCEFWYNSNWHSALGKSPFEILYGYTPRYLALVSLIRLLQWKCKNGCSLIKQLPKQPDSIC